MDLWYIYFFYYLQSYNCDYLSGYYQLSTCHFFLVIFEIYLTKNSNLPEINKAKIKEDFEKNSNKNFETRSKYQFFKDLSIDNKND